MGGKSADPNKAAMRQQRAQMERLDDLELPELQQYILQNPELVGLLEEEQLDPSALEEISLDPAARESQLAALESLQEYADTGTSDTDKYAMEQMLSQVGAQQKSNQADIEADMARKGMDSSGASLMAKMSSGQQGANDARERTMQLAAQGQQNRMGALNQLASQSGNMQQQDFARQAQVGSAKDAIARANAANRYQTSAANLSARQAIENQRANTANQQAQVGNQIAQQNFQNQYSKTGAQGNVANSMSQIAGNTPQGPSGIQQLATVGGGVVGAIYGGPAGAAAGAQAGSAVGGMFEDGGIAKKYEDGGVHSNFQDGIEARKRAAQEKEDKQHDAFKKKYMKKVRDELSQDPSRHDMVHAEDGAYFNKAAMQSDMNKLTNGQDVKGMALLGQGNDATSGDIQTNQEAQELLSPKSENKLSGRDMTQALGALGKLMDRPEKGSLKLGSNVTEIPENIMNPVGPQQYANPYEGLQGTYKDGGLPEYGCGGKHEAMYASDGEGDIVDSGMESYAGDRVDAKINDGEAILNVPQQQRFMDLVRGKISLDELGDDDIVEGVPSEYREELHEKLESPKQSSKMKGLEKLLEMLGEEE